VLREEIINGKYFWVNKKSIGCLLDGDTVLERVFGQK
jgi:hypothetical protein